MLKAERRKESDARLFKTQDEVCQTSKSNKPVARYDVLVVSGRVLVFAPCQVPHGQGKVGYLCHPATIAFSVNKVKRWLVRSYGGPSIPTDLHHLSIVILAAIAIHSCWEENPRLTLAMSDRALSGSDIAFCFPLFFERCISKSGDKKPGKTTVECKYKTEQEEQKNLEIRKVETPEGLT